MIDFNPIQKLPQNVEDLAKLIAVKGLKTCPKSNKSPNLAKLVAFEANPQTTATESLRNQVAGHTSIKMRQC